MAVVSVALAVAAGGEVADGCDPAFLGVESTAVLCRFAGEDGVGDVAGRLRLGFAFGFWEGLFVSGVYIDVGVLDRRFDLDGDGGTSSKLTAFEAGLGMCCNT